MYANSRFIKEQNEYGQVTKYIEPGEEISQSDLGCSDEEWEELQERNAVVEEYPDDLDPSMPLAQYEKEKKDKQVELEEAEAEVAHAEDASEAEKKAPAATAAQGQTGTSAPPAADPPAAPAQGDKDK